MNDKKWKGLPIVIIGKGGLGKKIEYTIKEINKYSKNDVYEFLGYVDDSGELEDKKDLLGKIEKINEIAKNKIIGVILGIGKPKIKSEIYEYIKNVKNIVFPNIIHPTVFMYDDIKMGIGNVIASGVNICASVEIGDFNFINLSSTIGHDVKIKNFCVINPLSSISGNVILENKILVGTGANILQNLKIGESVIVGGGALINRNCELKCTYIGVPGRKLNGNKE